MKKKHCPNQDSNPGLLLDMQTPYHSAIRAFVADKKPIKAILISHSFAYEEQH